MNTNLQRVTFTGLDFLTEVANIEQIIEDNMSNSELIPEFGILYSHDPSPARFRYPSYGCIERISYLLSTINPTNLSLHICGKQARRNLTLERLDNIIERFQRIQINGVVTENELDIICKTYPYHEIITQEFSSQNKELMLSSYQNHTIIMDSSGGRGKLIESFDLPNELKVSGKKYGFAGGLTPDNFLDTLQLMPVDENLTWVDIESGIRDNEDLLDLSSVVEILRLL